MRFGLFLLFEWPGPERDFPTMYEEVLAQIQYADALGFEVVWLAEHHFVSYSASPSPLMFAVKAAERTTRIRLGTGVLVLPFYHPLRIAGEVAQADLLTRGRLEIGVGRGAYPYEFSRYGVDMSEGRDRTQEALEIMIRAWTEDDISHAGRFYQFDPVTVLPKPRQQPHPPVWIAALSPESFHYAIQHGHHLISTVFRDPIPRVAEKIDTYRQALAAAGKKERDAKLGILRIAYVAESDEAARDVVPHIMKSHRTWHHLHYGTQQISRGVVAAGEAPNEPTEAEAFERLIVGSPERCIRQVKALQDVGVELLLLNMNFGNMTHAEAMRSLRLFGTEVLPAFR